MDTIIKKNFTFAVFLVSMLAASCTFSHSHTNADWRAAVIKAYQKTQQTSDLPKIPEKYSRTKQKKVVYIIYHSMTETRKRTLALIGGRDGLKTLPKNERKVVSSLVDYYTKIINISESILGDSGLTIDSSKNQIGVLNKKIDIIYQGSRNGKSAKKILSEPGL